MSIFAIPFNIILAITLRYFLSTFLIAIILIQPLQQAWVIVAFEMNKDFIARVLCINKDETPQKNKLRCAGSCQLRKELKQTTTNSSEERLSVEKHSDKSYTNPECFIALSEGFTFVFSEQSQVLYLPHSSKAFLDGTFHPPNC